MGVKVNDKAEDVRGKAQLDPEQWRQFKDFTKEEAKIIIRNGDSWVGVSLDKKKEILERVNKKLKEDHAPEVGMDIIDWRMPKAIKRIPGLGGASEQVEGELSGSTNEPGGRRLPWDPTRDEDV
ncbi:hypothetical protein AOQ84DRAFT_441310 [Glonium stellatum]|uniref:Uncharacterized protein n=1 Tax=Glonium stellatum TaxID=574774 RepID=A0A8E2EW63_9PEZI|nr:hypothetical protein AOQ84DRAFT_441310 [Glonium stellatum]